MSQNKQNNLEAGIELTSISPVAYILAKAGDLAVIKPMTPRANEYRANIGAASEAFLVFKGNTKIGMIPKSWVAQFGKAAIGRRCRILTMDKENNIIIIKLMRKISS